MTLRLAPLAALALLAGCDSGPQGPVQQPTFNVVEGPAPNRPPSPEDEIANAVTALPAPMPSPENMPRMTGRVVDNAGVLTPEQEAALTRRLEALEARTTDQFVIATLPSLRGIPIDFYAQTLGNQWGIGTATGNGNGVIMVVVPDDRAVRIEVGNGLWSVVSEAQTQQIVDRDLLPAFREGRWQEGIDAGAGAMIDILTANADAPRGAGATQ